MASKEKREEYLKKLLVLLGAVSAFTTYAQTTNWYVDGTLYQTTSCTSGDNVTPPSAPAKHGYTFAGWLEANQIMGSGVQYGTPSPTNPIYPTFYQDGDLILRAVGTDNNLIADIYNTETGKITRRIGIKVLVGTEGISEGGTTEDYYLSIDNKKNSLTPFYCSHFNRLKFYQFRNVGVYKDDLSSSIINVETFKQWLADQYAAGTPVTIYYPLATPFEENYTPAQ